MRATVSVKRRDSRRASDLGHGLEDRHVLLPETVPFPGVDLEDAHRDIPATGDRRGDLLHPDGRVVRRFRGQLAGVSRQHRPLLAERTPPQRHGLLAPDVRLPRLEDVVQALEEALVLELGRAADEVPSADDVVERRVRIHEDVVRPLRDGHEGGRLEEEGGEPGLTEATLDLIAEVVGSLRRGGPVGSDLGLCGFAVVGHAVPGGGKGGDDARDAETRRK